MSSRYETAECGTPSAKRRHRRRGETCETCKPVIRSKAPCGTSNAYKRGCRCDGCRVAHAAHKRATYVPKNGTLKQLAPCPSKAAKARHAANNEPCEVCDPTRGRKLRECGTWQARRRHSRNNETCETCFTPKPKPEPKQPKQPREPKQTKPRNLAPCGTTRAKERHRKKKETCDTCGPLYAPKPPLKPCGTVAAAKRHRANGEPPCEPCRQAETTYDTNLRRGKGAKERTNISTPDLIEEIRFLVNAGEGTHRILQATGYLGREGTLRSRLTQAGQHHLAQQALNPWDLAA